MSLKSEARDRSAKVLMVLESAEAPLSAIALAKTPILSDLSTRKIGAILRYHSGQKRVKQMANGSWVAVSKKQLPVKAVKTTEEKERPEMFFVLHQKTRTLFLDVGGLRLPVVIE